MPQPGSYSPDNILIKSPQSSHEWNDYYLLRWLVLRKPWQQPPGSERDELDNTSTHLMAVNQDNKVLGVGRLHMVDDTLAQIRYMAVHQDYQRCGIGSQILKALEHKAVESGATSVFLNARDSHLVFYTRLGFEPFATGHTLYGTITHTKVKKNLQGQGI